MSFGVNVIPSTWRSQPTTFNTGSLGQAYTAPSNYSGLDFLNDPNFWSSQQPQQQSYAAPDSGGGGGGDSGSYATAEAPAPAKILEQSPEWIAYLNSLGLEKSQFAADIERQRGLARAEADFRKQSLGPQFDQQRRNISASNESRGMARSGQQLRDLAVSRAAQNRQSTGIDMGLNATVSGLESSLAQKNLDLESQKQAQAASMIGAGYVHG